MTYERREEIFSKEVLTIAEIQELMSLQYNDACILVREIKAKTKSNFQIRGKLLVSDYLKYFGIDSSDRYYRKQAKKKVSPEAETEEVIKSSSYGY